VKYFSVVFIILLFTACSHPAGEEITKIPEASGISYCNRSDTLIVANDEGIYYEINTKGNILQKVKLGKYDLEGVVCEDEELLFTIENKGLLIIDRKTGKKKKITLYTSYQGKKLKLFNKKEGIEGIAKVDNIVYLAKQSKKKKRSFIAVVKLTPSPARIIDVIEHRIVDTSGLAYHEGYLYMVSDKEDLLIKYDLGRKKIVQKINLSKGAWEGIAFDDKGNIYFADDDGRIVKYEKKVLGL
jgi:uncharacterized protein YjiK